MKVIILSAGQGRRLLPLTTERPKAALPVGTRSVLEWQLHEISACAVEEVVVVTGFGADYIDEILESQSFLPARAVYNPFYAQSDNLGTCWIARHEMRTPFCIINGDTLFEADILKRLLAAPADHQVTLVTDSKARYEADDMKVITAAGQLKRVGKQLDSPDVNGESIGMMRFNQQGAARFGAQVDHMMRYGTGLNQWYLSAIDALASEGIVGVCSIDGSSWGEIDDQSDLEKAARIVTSWPALERPT